MGPVTGGPFTGLDIPFTTPERMRLGALMRHSAEIIAARTAPITVGGHELTVCAASVLVDGEPVDLTPAQMALMRALARRPGASVSRAELTGSLSADGTTPDTLEAVMSGLDRSLGVRDVVTTMAGCGYRLDV